MLGQSPKKLVSGSGKRNFAGRDKRAGMAPKTNFAFEGDKSRARNAAISGHSATNGEISVRARLYGRAGRLELLTKRLRTARADHLSCLHMRFGMSDTRYFSTSDVGVRACTLSKHGIKFDVDQFSERNELDEDRT